MKKKTFLAAVAVALVAILSLGTLAFYTFQTDEVVNTFTTVGGDEENNPAVAVKVDDVFEDGTMALPGTTVDKVVGATYQGTIDGYVRLVVTVDPTVIPDLTALVDENTTDYTLDADTTAGKYVFTYNSVVTAADGADVPLAKIFNEVAFADDFVVAEGTENFTITVVAQSVQAAGFASAAEAFAATFDAPAAP